MRKVALILSFATLLLVLSACRQPNPVDPQPLVTTTVTEVESTPSPVATEPPADTATEPPATATTPPTEAEPEPTEVGPIPTSEVRVTESAAPVIPEISGLVPSVVYSSPASGEEVLLNGTITVRFNQPMDQTSVEDAFSIDGDVEGAFVWTRPDELTFTPAGQLTRQQSYTVQIADSARNLDGKMLREPLALRFETIGILEVGQLLPADNTRDVAVDSAITIVFNRPVVPLVSTSQQADLIQPISFSPAIVGNGEWVNTSIYRFTPTEPLLAATTYNLQTVDELQDVTGSTLAEPFAASFTTVSPDVVVVDTGDRETIAPTQTVSVTFNMPMSRPETEAAILWQPQHEKIYTWSADGRTVGITPVGRMAMETAYTLHIGPSAMAAIGRAEMGNPHLTNVETFPLPGINSVRPENGSTMSVPERLWQEISFDFKTPMDRTSIIDRIQIDPPPPVDEISYLGNRQYFTLKFPLVDETTYQITIPADVKDIYGNELGEPYIWTFTTPPASTVGSFNLTNDVAQLSRSYPSKVDFVHRNLDSVKIELQRYPDEAPLAQLAAGYLGYPRTQFPPGEIVREWTFEYEPKTAGSTELLLADGEALPTGVYRLVAYSSQLTGDWHKDDVLLIVAETNLALKETPDNVYVWATDLHTGQPAAGRSLTFYYQTSGDDNQRITEFATAVTDQSGWATVSKTSLPVDSYSNNRNHTTLVATGEQGAFGFGLGGIEWHSSVSPYSLVGNVNLSSETAYRMYLHTDRPLYRPGDTVYIRGWVRTNDYSRYTLDAPDNVSIKIVSADVDNQWVIDFEVDDNGGFYGEWQLPDDAELGNWVMYGDDGDQYGASRSRDFTVAQFRKPEYLVEVTPNQSDQLRGENVSVVVSADYFFGGPAANLPIQYVILAYDHTNSLSNDRRFSFSTNLCEYACHWYGWEDYGSYIDAGEGVTSADGTFTIEIPAEQYESYQAGSLRLNIEASITDSTGLAVAGRTDVVLHTAELYAGLARQRYVSTVEQGVGIDVITVDWDGTVLGNRPVAINLIQREWEAVPSQYDPYRTDWRTVDTVISELDLTTNVNGRGTATLPVSEGGVYIVEATVTDSAERTQTSRLTTYIYGNNDRWRFDATDRQMEVTAAVDQLRVGDSAEILVQSPFPNMLAWMTIERGDLIEQQLITLESTSELVTLDILPAYAPNVYVSFMAVKGADDSERPVADIRYGIVELTVSPEQFALDIEITPDQPLYSPRDTVTYAIKATDYLGNGVSADLSLALVDLAVLTLKEETLPPIIDHFYSPQPLRSRIGSGLFISGEGLDVRIPEQPFGGGGGGGGGAQTLAEALTLDRDTTTDENGDVRDDFRDVAHWEAAVTTDANGEATVTVTLPDNLTTWRLNARAITANTRVGETSTDIVATRQLLIRPVTPRFLTFGDRVQMTAVVHNNSLGDIDATVLLEAEGVSLNGPAEQAITIAAGGSTLVRWPVTVQDVDSVDLIFRVEGGGFRDASRPTVGEIPVYRYNAEDVVATAGVLRDQTQRVEAVLLPPLIDSSEGDLAIEFSSSLAASIVSALDVSRSHRPASADGPIWECTYATAQRLLPNAASAQMIRALDLDMPDLLATLDQQINDQIDTLHFLQMPGGGWGHCGRSQPEEWTSAFTLHALSAARQAGYDVNDETLYGGALYTIGSIKELELDSTAAATKKAYILYIASLSGPDVTEELNKLLDEGRELLLPHAAAMVAMGLHNSGADVPASLLSDISNATVVNATGAHWEGGSALSFGTDLRTTAVVVDALAQVDPENALLPNAVRWLMEARTGRYWRSTQETSWTIAALSRWMQVSGELDADYNYTLRVNESLMADDRFADGNIMSQQQVSIPIDDLSTTDLNILDIQKNGSGSLYYTAYLNAFVSTESVEAVDRGFTVARAYYDAACETACDPLTTIASGQEVRVELTIVVKHNRRFVRIEDPLPAGADAIDPNLDTSASAFGADVEHQRGYWGWWYFSKIQFQTEKVVIMSDYLPAGTYQYSYHLQPIVPGVYQVRPTIAHETFQPELFGRADGMLFTITE